MKYLCSVLCFSLSLISLSAKTHKYQEVEGVCVVEAETIRDRSWSLVKDPSVSGGKYIIWEGKNRYNKKDIDDVMTVEVKINKPGVYHFKMLFRQTKEGYRGDEANDLWLFFPEGEIVSEWAPKKAGFAKVFGRARDEFKFGGNFDFHKHKPATVIRFKEAGNYEMQIAARSKGLQLDKVVLYHKEADKKIALDPKTAESAYLRK